MLGLDRGEGNSMLYKLEIGFVFWGFGLFYLILSGANQNATQKAAGEIWATISLVWNASHPRASEWGALVCRGLVCMMQESEQSATKSLNTEYTANQTEVDARAAHLFWRNGEPSR
jgi:hypothetical protein